MYDPLENPPTRCANDTHPEPQPLEDQFVISVLVSIRVPACRACYDEAQAGEARKSRIIAQINLGEQMHREIHAAEGRFEQPPHIHRHDE